MSKIIKCDLCSTEYKSVYHTKEECPQKGKVIELIDFKELDNIYPILPTITDIVWS